MSKIWSLLVKQVKILIPISIWWQWHQTVVIFLSKNAKMSEAADHYLHQFSYTCRKYTLACAMSYPIGLSAAPHGQPSWWSLNESFTLGTQICRYSGHHQVQQGHLVHYLAPDRLHCCHQALQKFNFSLKCKNMNVAVPRFWQSYQSGTQIWPNTNLIIKKLK